MINKKKERRDSTQTEPHIPITHQATLTPLTKPHRSQKIQIRKTTPTTNQHSLHSPLSPSYFPFQPPSINPPHHLLILVRTIQNITHQQPSLSSPYSTNTDSKYLSPTQLHLYHTIILLDLIFRPFLFTT